jgi:O-antigen/teichoic acid export membrane protein
MRENRKMKFVQRVKMKFGDQNLFELVSKSLSSFGIRSGGLLAGFLFTLVSARWFGSKAMGLLALFQLFLIIISLIGRCGLDVSVVKLLNDSSFSHDKSRRQLILKMAKLVLVVSSSASLLLFSSSSFVATHWFHDSLLRTPLRMAAFSIPLFSLLYLNAGMMRALKKTNWYMFLVNGGIPLVATLVLVSSYSESAGLLIPIFSYVIGVAIVSLGSILVVYYYFRSGTDKETNPSCSTSTANLLRISVPMMISGGIAFLMGWTDTFMLGLMSTTDGVGIYNVSFRLAALVAFPLVAVNSIAAPKFAEMNRTNDSAVLSRFSRQASAMIFWSSLPIGLVFIVFSHPFLGFFGSVFVSGSLAFSFLVVGHMINSAAGPVGQLLNMTGKQVVLQNTALVALLINVVLNYTLIPLLGIAGAAIATACSGALWNLMCIGYLMKKDGMRTFYLPFFSRVS